MRLHWLTISRFVLLLFGSASIALTASAQKNAAERYEIDAKRIGVSPVSKDALPRSREFIRLDSTYYVGWMYDGLYKFDRSADYLGYKNAIPSLQKAFDLIEKDYGNTFKNMFSSILFISQNINRLQDLYMIYGALREAYGNIEQPDLVISLLDRIEKFHFRKDYFNLNANRAWTYHRSRFLTSANFSFLKNSVEENEKKAFEYSYKGLAQIKKNKELNDLWFGPKQSEGDILNIYFYLSMLHCYNKNYDSSEYYYQQLAARGGISWNNYASMQHEIGNFHNAISYYEKDKFKSQHILKEPYYYLPILYIYGGKTKDAINMTQQIIAQNGSTPGFGWYNISLARAYLYDGQLDSAAIALDKAANFKELHIGTTLTQTQYDFTINLLRVQLADKKIAAIKFLNRGWWYSPKALYSIASLKIEKLLAEYVVVNQLAYNPERNRLVYELFCSESTSSFDEAWYLLKDFSPAFFLKKYQGYEQSDKRQNVQRYFKLFDARFAWQDGKKDEAREAMERMERTTVLDTANEKLFMARLYEALSIASKNDDRKDNYIDYGNNVLDLFPLLVPFSGIKIQAHLEITGVEDAVTKRVIDELKECNIDWVNKPGVSTATASLNFDIKGNKYQVILNMRSGTGKSLVTNGRLIFLLATGVGNELALRLFGKGGSLEFEMPELKK